MLLDIKIKLCNIRCSWKIFKPKDYGYVWNASENSLVMIMDKDKILILHLSDIHSSAIHQKKSNKSKIWLAYVLMN